MGGKIAAPIWAEFSEAREVQLPEYSDTRQFPTPNGVSTVRLDKVTNLLADASCPQDYDAVFLDGTAPTQTCDQGAGDQRNVFQKLFGIGKENAVVPAGPSQRIARFFARASRCQYARGQQRQRNQGHAPLSARPATEEKEGFFRETVWR